MEVSQFVFINLLRPPRFGEEKATLLSREIIGQVMMLITLITLQIHWQVKLFTYKIC